MADPATRRCCLGWDFSTQQVLSRPRVRAGSGRRRLCDVGRAGGDLGAATAGPSLGRNCVSDFSKTRRPSGTTARQRHARVRCVRDPARTRRSRKRRPLPSPGPPAAGSCGHLAEKCREDPGDPAGSRAVGATGWQGPEGTQLLRARQGSRSAHTGMTSDLEPDHGSKLFFFFFFKRNGPRVHMNFVPLLVGTSVPGLRCPTPLAREQALLLPGPCRQASSQNLPSNRAWGACQWAP